MQLKIQKLRDRIASLLSPDKIRILEPMKYHTTFCIGGPVDALFMPESEREVLNILEICRELEIPWMAVGEGSNLLVRDSGIRGVALKTNRALSRITVDPPFLQSESGASLSAVCHKAAAYGLSGLEFAYGIPGSIGGAVVMNAGAYGNEICELITRVWIIDENQSIRMLSKNELNFSYRNSIFQQKQWLIVRVELALHHSNEQNIRHLMHHLIFERRAKQPLDLPSAGSVFKRPAGIYVGPLVSSLGLKGCRVHDAQISKKHGGFIVNLGNASAADVLQLIQHTQTTVQQKRGIILEPEVQIIGEDRAPQF